jgi:hypothetical protein|nr:MAG TPA: hypothetical protein [Caudoviricetes sp.]
MIRQNIKGNNNIQVANNNAPIIHTGELKITMEVVHDPEQHITDSQALQVREKIVESGMILASNGGNKRSLIKKQYGKFYKKFGVTKYELLPKDKFEEAMKWLQKEIAASRKVLKESDPEEWRKAHYKAINARGRQMGMDKEALLIYTTRVLVLDNTLLSLKNLNDDQLQKLYNYMFRKKL